VVATVEPAGPPPITIASASSSAAAVIGRTMR
jgi:hypothetical protein